MKNSLYVGCAYGLVLVLDMGCIGPPVQSNTNLIKEDSPRRNAIYKRG